MSGWGVLVLAGAVEIAWSQTVPVGTAYVVFTGIGAIGAVTLGVALHDDPLSLGRLAALALIVGGIALARATAGP
ncbi:SMR family transporter [Mumia zhuanghuii]|uniref:QacE family quaternary ammonium compound efflux SMR transporter n=1 Tax=Mumia zhuanghuii TaxID=2585211 RepID=A0A5C4MFF6_9ACTN|nr:SMR family transporter [Mumia zhuanghuii]TNC42520.1 hypothetical protein FHE65_20820 [Mumia zhuanghuii]TNC42546.1 hypothetical protein FHE65_20615 [Mumia zhuanghuii]